MCTTAIVAPAPARIVAGGVEIIDSLAQDWRELCDEGTLEHPFCRPEWIAAHARAFHPGQEFFLVAGRAEGRLQALLPLVRGRGRFVGIPVRKLQSAGNSAQRFDLLRVKGARGDAAVSEIWRAIRENHTWDVIEFMEVPSDAGLWRLLAEAEKDGFPTGYRPAFDSPYLRLSGLPPGEDPWLARTSGSFRKNLRRAYRQLAEQGPHRFRSIDCPSPAELNCLWELELSTWKGRRGCAVASEERTRRFFDDVIPAAVRFGYLSLHLLELGGRVIAAQLGATCRGNYYGLRCAHDEAFRQLSPGHVTVNYALRSCAARGLTEFHFNGEAHEWKMAWAPELRPHGFCYVFRRGLFGRGLHSIKFGVVPLGRKLLGKPLPGRQSRKEGNK